MMQAMNDKQAQETKNDNDEFQQILTGKLPQKRTFTEMNDGTAPQSDYETIWTNFVE